MFMLTLKQAPGARRRKAKAETKPVRLFVMVDEDSATYRQARPDEILASAEAATRKELARHPITSVADARRYLFPLLSGREQEVFSVLFLDNKHRVIQYEEMFFGTIDNSAVHPREVVKRALFHNAAAAIVAHNHPSGIAEPSRADELITVRLKEALALVDVRLIDHVIVGETTVSLAERGVL